VNTASSDDSLQAAVAYYLQQQRREGQIILDDKDDLVTGANGVPVIVELLRTEFSANFRR